MRNAQCPQRRSGEGCVRQVTVETGMIHTFPMTTLAGNLKHGFPIPQSALLHKKCDVIPFVNLFLLAMCLLLNTVMLHCLSSSSLAISFLNKFLSEISLFNPFFHLLISIILERLFQSFLIFFIIKQLSSCPARNFRPVCGIGANVASGEI